MRIQRLDLQAFGPFTGASLSLSDGREGLHIVYGPNEAGKSSALRGLRYWLYGIPQVCSDAFEHPYSDLRLGGVLQSKAGETLEFVRRKGRANTLRHPDHDGVIDDSRLAEFLLGVDAATFQQRFGIDYVELRRGGEAVVSGGGDLGQILFAAGAGLVELGQIRDQLQTQAAEIYRPKATKTGMKKLLADLKEQRREIRNAQLSTTEWVRVDQSLQSSLARVGEIRDQLEASRARLGRLRRIENSLPLIGRLRRNQALLDQVADAPLLPAGFPEQRAKASVTLENERRRELEAKQDVARLETQIAQLDFPAALLEHAATINRLYSRLGSHQKASADRPELVRRREFLQQRARSILEELGRDPQLEQARELRLTVAQRHRIQELTEACQARIDRQTTADRNAQALEQQIQDARRELEQLAAASDVTTLKQALRATSRLGDLDKQWSDGCGEVAAKKRQANVQLSRLPLWDGPLEELERLAVPTRDTVDRFESLIPAAETRVAQAEDRLATLTREVQDIEQGLERLRLTGEVPSEEDLVAARERRNRGWQLVRRGLLTDQSVTPEELGDFSAGAASMDDLADAVQASIEETDLLSDRLRREADVVAERAKLTADRGRLERRLDEQRANLTNSQHDLRQAGEQWEDVWQPLGIAPLSPREMRSWLDMQRKLVDLAEDIRLAQERVDAVEAVRREHQERFLGLLNDLNETPPTARDSLAVLLERCEAVVDRRETANRQRQTLQKSLDELQGKLPQVRSEADQQRIALDEWRSNWEAAVATLGLERDSKPSEANRVIEAVDELLQLLDDAADKQSRIDGIDRDARAFESDVARLLEEVAPELADLPVGEAVEQLYGRKENAIENKSKLDGCQEQRQARLADAEKARANVDQVISTVEAMCRQAAVESLEELEEAERRSVRHQELARDLEAIQLQLSELAAGASIETFAAEAESYEPDRISAEISGLDVEVVELERERDELNEQVGRQRNEIHRMDGSGAAAEAREKSEQLLSAIRSNAEQYVRLRLASVVLHQAIERYREANRGPVLGRASDLFADLTLGSFSGLRVDYDDKGKPLLLGVRGANGRGVPVTGMSEGSCDQLYLALRIALLESSLESGTRLPFVVDDVLVMFDDDRAVAALKVLAQLSEKTQVVFFTHHEHLLKLAQENLDSDVLFTHGLKNQVAVTGR